MVSDRADRSSHPAAISLTYCNPIFTHDSFHFYARAICSEAVLIVLFVLGRTLCEALAQSFVLNDLVNSFLSSQSWKIFEIRSKKLSEAPEVCLQYA